MYVIEQARECLCDRDSIVGEVSGGLLIYKASASTTFGFFPQFNDPHTLH